MDYNNAHLGQSMKRQKQSLKLMWFFKSILLTSLITRMSNALGYSTSLKQPNSKLHTLRCSDETAVQRCFCRSLKVL